MDSLIGELLLEIFEYLDASSLKSAALVCKRWSEIIGQSASIMRKLPLSFQMLSKEPGKLMRNYHSLKIERPIILDFKMFGEIENHLQSLTISYTVLENSKTLRDFLEKSKLLRTLSLIRVQIEDEAENFDEIKSPKAEEEKVLKKLEMIQTDHRILNHISTFQVIDLEIIDGSNNTDSNAMINFLQKQSKLRSLTLENLSDAPSAIFEADRKLEINFQLTKLSVLFSNIRNVDKFDESFIPFLRTQATSMKKLKVEGSLSPDIYKFIVKNCGNLDELEINVNELPQENSFYNFLGSNVMLKSLRLNGTITRSNLIGFRGILTHYHNVRGISLADTDAFVANDVFQVLSTIPRKLSDLSVLNFHGSFTANAVFPSLTHFSIKILHSIEQWKTFISRNESLETLNVGWIKRDQFTPSLIQEILELPGLRHLKFGGRFIACKRIYEVIKRDYRNLRTLELTVANYEEIKNLRFDFPANRSLWMPQCLYFDEGSDREPLND